MKNSLFTRILASGTVATLVLSLLLVVLPLPRAHARLLQVKPQQAGFGATTFGSNGFENNSADFDFGPDPFSPKNKKRITSKKAGSIDFFFPEWKEENQNNLTVEPQVPGPPSIASQTCVQDPGINNGRILNAAIVNGDSITRFIIQVADQAPGSQPSNSNEFQTPSAFGTQPFELRMTGFEVSHSYALRIAMQNTFTNGQTVYGPTLSFVHAGNGGGGGQQNIPRAQTGPATNMRTVTLPSGKPAVTVTLNGSIDPQGSNTYGAFRTRAVGSSWEMSNPVLLDAVVGQLLPGMADYTTERFSTNFEFQCIALRNNVVVAEGQTLNFTTPPAPGPTVQAPGVVTLPAELANNFVRFNGTVNPNGASTSYWFEYGQNGDFGLSTAQTTLAGTAGATTVSATVQAQPGTWNFRLAAQNQAGTTRGTILWITVPETGGGGGQTTITLIKAFWWSDTGMLKVEALAPQESQLRIVELGDFGYMQFKSGRFIKKTSMAEKPDSVTIRAKDGSQITVHVAAK